MTATQSSSSHNGILRALKSQVHFHMALESRRLSVIIVGIALFIQCDCGFADSFENKNYYFNDKLLHFFVSTGIAGSVTGLSDDALKGVAVSMYAGIAKEFYDKQSGSRFDKADLLADFAGSLTGAVLGKKLLLTFDKDKIIVTIRIP